MMKLQSNKSRSLLAAFAAVSLTSIYPYLEMNRSMGDLVAWVAMASLFLCPLVVCWIAGKGFVVWGMLTNLILLSWLILMVYGYRSDWHTLKLDALPLAIICVFGLLTGAGVGGLMERRYKKKRCNEAAA